MKVLIDTWWNVNLIVNWHEIPVEYVLIDTWWNVNTLMFVGFAIPFWF